MRVFTLLTASLLVLFFTGCSSPGIWTPPQHPDELSGLSIEYLARAVVKIVSSWVDDYDGSELKKESGAGILLGYRRDELFLMTAAHVVRSRRLGEADTILVSFEHAPRSQYRARLLAYDQDKDFAVITLTGFLESEDRESVVKFPVDFDYRHEITQDIKTIGHPRNLHWHVASGQTRRSRIPHLMSFTREAADRGNSGGPVLSSSHRLIGMVTAVEGGVGYALKITEIVGLLERWGVPYRPRFAGEFGRSLANIRDAIWDHEADQLKGAPYERKDTDYMDLWHSRIEMFGRGKALLANWPGAASPVTFYVENFGYFRNRDALDEGRRLLVRGLSEYLQGYMVEEKGRYGVEFSRFEWFRGKIIIEVAEFSGTLYVIIYRSETILNPAGATRLPLMIMHRLGS